MNHIVVGPCECRQVITEDLANEVAEAFDFRCAVGGHKCQGRLVLHHIKYKSRSGSDKKENLVLLCGFHHAEEHASRGFGWSLHSWEEEGTVFPARRKRK